MLCTERIQTTEKGKTDLLKNIVLEQKKAFDVSLNFSFIYVTIEAQFTSKFVLNNKSNFLTYNVMDYSFFLLFFFSHKVLILMVTQK